MAIISEKRKLQSLRYRKAFITACSAHIIIPPEERTCLTNATNKSLHKRINIHLLINSDRSSFLCNFSERHNQKVLDLLMGK